MSRPRNFKLSSGLATDLQHNFNVQGVGIQVTKGILFDAISRELAETSDITSYLGLPVFDEVVINSGNFFELTDLEKTNPIPFVGTTLHSVLLEVTQTKNIVTTSLQGRNSTVKEYINDGDFAITMTGVVVGETNLDLVDGEVVPTNTISDLGNQYPETDVNNLIIICQVPETLTMTSNFLQLFGINDVVITAYTINQLQATRDMQPFQISMLSDVPIELNELANEETS